MIRPDGASLGERLLVWLLRFEAAVLLLAFPTMLLPVSWMAATHRWLGLGEFPATPLVDYLCRSIAALYGFHGVLVWIVSTDVRRYRALVSYLAIMGLLFGVAILAVDLHAGMPWHWALFEGPPIFASAIVIGLLLRSVPSR